MRFHRFYVSQEIGDQKEITIESHELVHQLRDVFRIKRNGSVILFDGSGSDYTGELRGFQNSDQVVFGLTGSTPSRFTPARKIYLCAAVVKKDNFEFIAEKATELGVTDIVPVIAERTEKKAINEERLARIVTEASEQSGRGDVPMVHPILSFNEASAKFGGAGAIAFHTEGEKFDVADVSQTAKETPIVVFIGPEGGWSEKEVALFHENKTAVRCLGPQVLRAETAAVAALSQVVFNV